MKRIMLVLTALVLAIAMCGCGLVENSAATATIDPDAQYPVATITMENGVTMTAELYPQYAPNTVANFIELANAGFYDGLTFHRVVENFVIQTGNASSDATGTKQAVDYKIKGEVSENGFSQNTLKHTKGVLSMARTDESYDTASSQFFIVVADEPTYLDGKYAAFGKLVDDESIAAAVKISNVSVNSNNVPINDQRVASIRVETFGQTYTVDKITG